jgi:hypothetical protein
MYPRRHIQIQISMQGFGKDEGGKRISFSVKEGKKILYENV